MPTRETAVTETIEYETETCVHCGIEIATGNPPSDVIEVDGGPIAIGSEVVPRAEEDWLVVKGDTVAVRWVCKTCLESRYDYDGPRDVTIGERENLTIGADRQFTHKEFTFLLALTFLAGVLFVGVLITF